MFYSIHCINNCTSFVENVPKYLILSDAIGMELSLNFISDCSLLMHRNRNDFCVLILYSATLLNISRNSKDLTEAEEVKKRWQECRELYRKSLNDLNNMMVWSLT